jgi:hypothetical protein
MEIEDEISELTEKIVDLAKENLWHIQIMETILYWVQSIIGP